VARQPGIANRTPQREPCQHFAVVVLDSLGGHRDDDAVDALEAAGGLLLRPDPVFRARHALTGFDDLRFGHDEVPCKAASRDQVTQGPGAGGGTLNDGVLRFQHCAAADASDLAGAAFHHGLSETRATGGRVGPVCSAPRECPLVGALPVADTVRPGRETPGVGTAVRGDV